VLDGAPDRADDEFRGVMGILGGTGEAREFVARNKLLQLVADVLQPAENVSPARRKRALASSLAPKPVKRLRISCSSAVALRFSSSISSAKRMLARLSAARAFQPRASRRSPGRWKFLAGIAGVEGRRAWHRHPPTLAVTMGSEACCSLHPRSGRRRRGWWCRGRKG